MTPREQAAILRELHIQFTAAWPCYPPLESGKHSAADIRDALHGGAQALDAGGWQQERTEDRAGLIGQPIPDVVGTEPSLSVGEAREALNTQLQCMADEIRAWGCVVDAKVDDAIDDLIVASALMERARLSQIAESAPLTVCGICGEPSTAEVCKGCA